MKNLNKQFEQTDSTEETQQASSVSGSKHLSNSVNASLSADQSLFNNAFTQSQASYALSAEPSQGFLPFLKEKAHNIDDMNPKSTSMKDIDPDKVTTRQIFELLKSLKEHINIIDTNLPSTKEASAAGRENESSTLATKVQSHAAKIKQVSD